MDNYNDYIDEFLEEIKDSPYNTLKRFRGNFKKIRDLSPDEVKKFIKNMDTIKLSTRRVMKSTYKKFFQHINDTEMLELLDTISEVEYVPDLQYFYNVLEIKHLINETEFGSDRNNSLPRRRRTLIYAYLTFLGVPFHEIRNVDIYEFDEDKDIITHNNRVYDIREMDVNDTIRDEFILNKYALGIDYRTGEYVTELGGDKLVKSFKGTSLMRTVIAEKGGFAANTSLSVKDRENIIRSGAFIRLYNLKKKTGLSTESLFSHIDNEMMLSMGMHFIPTEYEEFEKAYKELGY